MIAMVVSILKRPQTVMLLVSSWMTVVAVVLIVAGPAENTTQPKEQRRNRADSSTLQVAPSSGSAPSSTINYLQGSQPLQDTESSLQTPKDSSYFQPNSGRSSFSETKNALQ